MKRQHRFACKITALILVVALLIGIAPLSVFAVTAPETVSESEAVDVLPAEIVAEETEKRDANTKVFHLSDGSYQAAVYPSAIHYKDAGGAWQEIDNTLVEKTANGKTALVAENGDTTIALPESFEDNEKATLTHDGASVAFVLSEQVLQEAVAAVEETEETETVEAAPEVVLAAQESTVAQKELAALESAAIQDDAPLKAALIAEGKSVAQLDAALQSKKAALAKEEAKAAKAAENASDAEKKLAELEEKNREKTQVHDLASAAVYADLLPSTDVEYIVSPGKLKENIVIKEAQDSYIYRFNMDIGALVPAAQGDGSIVLKSGAEDKFTIETPYVYDALGAVGSAAQTLEEVGGQWVLTVKADAQWLNDAARVFPVVLDPTVRTEGVSTTQDTYVTSALPEHVTSNDPIDKNTLRIDAGSTRRRGYVYFPLPDSLFEDFQSKNILLTNATMRLYPASESQNLYMNVYAVQMPWSESTTTWNAQPASNATNGYQTAKILDARHITQNNTLLTSNNYAINITQAAIAWANGTLPNYGVMLAANDESGSGTATFRSKENWSSSSDPLALFTYLKSYGMESWFSYESFDIGRAGTAHVNDYFRTAQLERSELGIATGKMPVNITRSYWQTWNDNALKTQLNNGSNRPYGKNWKINYNQSLHKVTDTELVGNSIATIEYWEYTGARGEVTRYREPEVAIPNDDNTKNKWLPEYQTEENANSYLWVPNSGENSGNIELISGAGIHKFNTSGFLTDILSPLDSNDKISISYSSGARISQITDGSGRKYVFTYTNNLLTSIAAQTAGDAAILVGGTPLAMSYSYDASGNLTSVSYPDGESVSYAYADNFVQLTDVDNYKIKLNLSGIRVTSVQEFAGSTAGGTLTITRDNEHQNTFTDNKGNVLHKQFDFAGRTIATIDGEGRYSASAYEKEENLVRGVYLASSGSATASVNLLTNHSGETSGAWEAWEWGGPSASGINLADTEAAFAGAKSLSLSNTADFTTQGALDIVQTIPATKWAVGDTLTLAVKTKIAGTLAQCEGNNLAYGTAAFISFRNSDGIVQEPASTYITSTNSEWTTMTVSGKVPTGTTQVTAGVMLINAKGTVYTDAWQLEKGKSVGVYNYAETSDFSDASLPAAVTNATVQHGYRFSKKLSDLGQSTYSDSGTSNSSSSTTTSLVQAQADYKLLATTSRDVVMQYAGAKAAVEAALTSGYRGYQSYTANESLRLSVNVDNSGATVSGSNRAGYWKAGDSQTELGFWSNGSMDNGEKSFTPDNVASFTSATTAPHLYVKISAGRNVATQTGFRRTNYVPNNGKNYLIFAGNVTMPNPNISKVDRDKNLNANVKILTGNGGEVATPINVPVGAKAGDEFLVGVWVKGYNTAPLSLAGRTFGLSAGGKSVHGDPANTDWQYIQMLVKVTSDTLNLPVNLTYSNQTGQAFFDGLQVQLYRPADEEPPEETPVNAHRGVDLGIDDNGHLTGTRMTDGTQSMYSLSRYDSNGFLSKSIDSLGNTVESVTNANTGLLQSVTAGGNKNVIDTGINLLTNESFEDEYVTEVTTGGETTTVSHPERADEWTHYANPNSGFAITRTAAAKRTGDWGYTLTRSTTGAAVALQTYGGVVPGETYRFSGWFKVPSGSITGDGAGLKIEVQDADKQQLGQYDIYSTRKKTGDWEQIAVTITLPAEGRYLCLKARVDGIGTAYVDDLRVEATQNVFPNGGFEGNSVAGVAPGWNKFSSTDTDAVYELLADGGAKEGAKYQKISRPSVAGVAAVSCEYSAFVPGATYRLSGWVKIPAPITGTGGMALCIQAFDKSGGTAVYVGGNMSPEIQTTNGWIYMEHEYTMPPASAGATHLRVQIRMNNAVGAFYIDDAKLTRVDGIAPSPAATSAVTYGYNAMGALAQVQQNVSGLTGGTALGNSYEYEHDRLKSITHNGFTYNFTYDAWGNQKTVKVGNSTLVTYNYNTTGERALNNITYANGQVISYAHNDDGQIIGISTDGDADFEFTYAYDADGAPTQAVDVDAGTKWVFDLNGASLRKISDNSPIYEAKPGQTPGSAVETFLGQSYTYAKPETETNEETGVTTVTQSVAGAANYSGTVVTDYFGRVNSKSVSLGTKSITTNYAYTSLPGARTTNQVANITNTVDGESETYSYKYDTKGNIVEIKLNGAVVATYEYDEAGQLVRENDTEISYDKGGNIIEKDGVVFEYDSVWKDKLTKVGDDEIEYDLLGNPTQIGEEIALEWNGRQLTNYDGNVYTYDADGLRTRKNNTAYTWVGDMLIGEKTGDVVTKYLYSGSALVGFNRAGSSYFYVKNLQGDVTAVVDSDGEIVNTYSYDAWGTILTSEEEVPQAIRYRGYYFDSETGLYYCQSRYYNPTWSRWISADSVLDKRHFNGLNLYAYCWNNAVNYFDFDGQKPLNIRIQEMADEVWAAPGFSEVIDAESIGDILGVAFYLLPAGILKNAGFDNLANGYVDYLEKENFSDNAVKLARIAFNALYMTIDEIVINNSATLPQLTREILFEFLDGFDGMSDVYLDNIKVLETVDKLKLPVQIVIGVAGVLLTPVAGVAAPIIAVVADAGIGAIPAKDLAQTYRSTLSVGRDLLKGLGFQWELGERFNWGDYINWMIKPLVGLK
jgi:RHS repeat-associated protein